MVSRHRAVERRHRLPLLNLLTLLPLLVVLVLANANAISPQHSTRLRLAENVQRFSRVLWNAQTTSSSKAAIGFWAGDADRCALLTCTPNIGNGIIWRPSFRVEDANRCNKRLAELTMLEREHSWRGRGGQWSKAVFKYSVHAFKKPDSDGLRPSKKV